MTVIVDVANAMVAGSGEDRNVGAVDLPTRVYNREN
jgi:hypothetical protein